MLRKVRITFATIVFAMITLLFLDFTDTMHHYFGWLAKIQFLPALLAVNVVVLVALILLTLLFGRIYCSVICPLGVMQDVLSHVNRKKNRYSYRSRQSRCRYLMLVVLVVAIVAGVGSVVGLLAPYSSYGRMVQSMLQPAYIGVNNLLAVAAQSMDSYAFYHREIWVRSVPVLLVAVVSFIVVAVLAIKGGRTYCNTICPVGTILGFLSRFAWFKVVINAEACKNCRKCERNCKASCIDLNNHQIDYSRCVVCGNCLEQCSFKALSFAHTPASAPASTAPATVPDSFAVGTSAASPQDSPAHSGRRQFLIGTGLAVAGAALAQEKKKVDGGLAVIEDKVQPERIVKLTPPGSLSAENMRRRCTGCQLCVSDCPNDVLRPSIDLMTIMQPVMSFEKGYCRPECNTCSSVCPAGAIKPITLEDKSSTQIGHAVWVKKNCVAVCDKVDCGNCANHCPTGAIQMIHPNDDESQPKIPVINEARCIGCGACEYVCPARPFSAIYVEGHEVHKMI